MNLVQVFNGKYNVTVIDNDQYIGNVIRHGYEWDGWMREDIKKYYIDDTDIIDIGANIGYNTLMFSDYGPVHSFEPVFHKIAEMNIKNNKLKNNVKLYSFALSDTCDKVSMYIPKSATDQPSHINYGGTSMVPSDAHNTDEPIVCDCDMLDNVYSGVPSIIKIDVENAEMNVLRGSKGILEKYKPTLLIEIFDLENSEIPRFLKSVGYTKAPIPRPEAMYIFTSDHLSNHLRPCSIV